MKVNVTEKSPVLVEIAVELPWEQVSAALDEAYAKVGKKARIRGFRPGKVPRKLLERYFGLEVTQDVGGRLVTESLMLAIEQRKLRPVTKPSVEPSRMEPGTPFRFRAQVEVRPKISELAIDGLSGKRPSAAVEDEEVETQLQSIRRAQAVLRTPDPPRPAAKGDVVKVDYDVSVEGTTRADMGARDRAVELGTGEVLPEFEAALVGSSVGDERTATHTFDPEGGRPELRGKAAVFTIRVKSIQELVLPALDDELAKDIGDHETLDALRASVRERILEQKQVAVERAVKDSVVADFCDKNPIPVPPSLVEDQIAQMERSLLEAVSPDPKGLRLSDEMREKLRPQAERKVRAGLLIMELARQRGLAATDEDVEARLESIAKHAGKNIAKVRAEIATGDRLDALKAQLVEEKALDLLLRKATIVDVAASEGEAAAPPPP